jgi:magnesium transporter
MNVNEALARSCAERHPERVARLTEVADPEQLAAFFQRLEPELAATVASHQMPLAASRALAKLEPKFAARILQELHPQLAVVFLRRLESRERDTIVSALSSRSAKTIKALMRYRPDQAASRVDPRAPTVPQDISVAQAIQLVMQAPEGALHYVYVLDENSRLAGVVTMRELMAAKSETRISAVMTGAPVYLNAADPLDAVLAHPGWKKVHAMPVVDEALHLVGVIRYSQFRQLEAERGQVQSGGSTARTAQALAELFWIGVSAMARVGEVALLDNSSDRLRGES